MFKNSFIDLFCVRYKLDIKYFVLANFFETIKNYFYFVT